PTGVQTNAVVPATENYKFEIDLGGKSGNLNSLGWRADDTYELYRIYEQNPDWFRPDTIGNFSRKLIGHRSLKEQVDAAYLEANTRWNKWRFNGGLRHERTRTKGLIFDPRPRAEIVAAGYPVNASGAPTTIEGIYYQYHNGERFARYGDYDDRFFSGGAKYEFSRRLVGQLSASESILRPDYNNLAGVTTINESAATVTVPNPNLKPETSTKIFAGLRYYFEPAGTISVSAFRLSVKNQLSGRVQLTPEQAGLDPADYAGYTILGFLNGEGTRTIDGAVFDYDQKLTLLPGVLRGLSVFGSFTYAETEGAMIGHLPRSANGGIRFRYRDLNLQVRGTWQDSQLLSITQPLNGELYLEERTLIDLSASYRLTRHFELMLSARNIFNAPSIRYSNVPGRVQMYDVYGSLWNVGIKGTF
ncbi:MAG TPA: TonB-dependent receptor, partial [Candidatus Synoicihabitans sp.]|nr:TonB-dependent receptor [Candidatus Synoicihabitans sp.]